MNAVNQRQKNNGFNDERGRRVKSMNEIEGVIDLRFDQFIWWGNYQSQ